MGSLLRRFCYSFTRYKIVVDLNPLRVHILDKEQPVLLFQLAVELNVVLGNNRRLILNMNKIKTSNNRNKKEKYCYYLENSIRVARIHFALHSKNFLKQCQSMAFLLLY